MAGWVAFFKYASVVISAASGVFALFVDYKDRDTNRITRAGWIAMTFIVVAAAITATTQLLEDRIKVDETREAKRVADQEKRVALRNVQQQLAGTERALYPFTNLSSSVIIKFPIHLGYFKDMREELRSAFLEDPRPLPQPSGCLQGFVRYHDNSEAVRFVLDRCPGTWENEHILEFIVDQHSPVLLVFDGNITPVQLPGQPSLSFRRPRSEFGAQIRQNLAYEYNFTRDELIIEYPVVASPPATLSISAPIASFLDLAGKSFVVGVRPGATLSGDDAKAFEESVKATTVERFVLTVGQRTVTMNKSRLRHERDKDGYIWAFHQLPATHAELLAHR